MLSGLDGTDSGPDVKASTTVMALMEASAVEHRLVSVQRQRRLQTGKATRIWRLSSSRLISTGRRHRCLPSALALPKVSSRISRLHVARRSEVSVYEACVDFTLAHFWMLIWRILSYRSKFQTEWDTKLGRQSSRSIIIVQVRMRPQSEASLGLSFRTQGLSFWTAFWRALSISRKLSLNGRRLFPINLVPKTLKVWDLSIRVKVLRQKSMTNIFTGISR